MHISQSPKVRYTVRLGLSSVILLRDADKPVAEYKAELRTVGCLDLGTTVPTTSSHCSCWAGLSEVLEKNVWTVKSFPQANIKEFAEILSIPGNKGHKDNRPFPCAVTSARGSTYAFAPWSDEQSGFS